MFRGRLRQGSGPLLCPGPVPRSRQVAEDEFRITFSPHSARRVGRTIAALTGQAPTRPDRKEYDMSNQNTGGVSPRSLILLGAFAALALNRDLRRGLVDT